MKKNHLATAIMVSFTSFCFAQITIPKTTVSNDGNTAGYQSAYKSLPDTSSGYAINDDLPWGDARKQKTRRQVPWYVERFKLSAGVFWAINNTDIKIGNSSGQGTDVNFEHDLGFKRSIGTLLGDFQWRASSRSRFDLSYYGVNRNSSYTLQKDIHFGDHDYPVDASVNAFVNNHIYRFSYGYAILSKPTYEAGLIIGAHVVNTSVGLGLNGSNVNTAFKDNYGVTAPLPDIGLWGGVTLSDRWAINAEASYLALTIDNITGRIFTYNAIAVFKVVPNFNLSAGYTGLNFKVDATRNNLNGHLQWGYNGPSLTASFSFGGKAWN